MKYIESPQEYDGPGRGLFLAGGITGCPDWQRQVVASLNTTDLVVFNPRRPDFPIGDPLAAPAQIAWEYRHLRSAAAILFWFPCETPCPIVLYELGAWSVSSTKLFIGAHPDYQRRLDVVEQTRLVRPRVPIYDSISALVNAVIEWEVA